MSDEQIVEREPIDVMLVRVADEPTEIKRAWARFESRVGLRGRKFYGAFDPLTATYSVCTVLRPDDDPDEQIGPTARRLAQRPDVDRTRPTLELYRRHDVIDVLVPIA